MHVRYEGTDTALPVLACSVEEMINRFVSSHRQIFGFIDETRHLIIETIGVEAVSASDRVLDLTRNEDSRPDIEVLGYHPVFMNDQWHHTPFYDRGVLAMEAPVMGPAVITDPVATTVVEPGWCAEVSVNDHLMLRRVVPLPFRRARGARGRGRRSPPPW